MHTKQTVSCNFNMSIFFVSARLRPEVEVNAQVEGALAAEVNSIVLDTLEHLVQVLYFVFLVNDLFYVLDIKMLILRTYLSYSDEGLAIKTLYSTH